MSRNILFVLINSIDPKSGGVSRVCYTLSAYWRNQGLSTFCITNVKSNAKFEYNDVYTFPYRMSNVEGNQAFLLDLIKKLEIRCLIIEYPDVRYLKIKRRRKTGVEEKK